MLPIVLGTAGHIDHGKTSLVHALTGIDTDRLPIEKARGITTELGFAHLDLDGRRVSVVDVPGHERFVKSMVAGAGGVDLVCLVIAADEGVMPQTREHLDICQLLGVQAGVVALTKRDLVDEEWLGLVTGELRSFLAGSFLADAPIVPVSARAGLGLDALKQALGACIRGLPARDVDGVFRLPIDRVFTVKGIGTVVTGTVAGGRIRVGDEVVVHPRGRATRVRGLEIHGVAVEAAQAGARVAINLHGLAVDDLVRGDVLAVPGAVVPSHILDVQLRYLPAATEPLPVRSKVLLHHATTQVMATLQLAERVPLAPGATAVAQLRVDATTPLAALPGDHFIVRGFAPLRDHGTTLGGGTLVRVQAPKARTVGHAQEVQALSDAVLTERAVLDVRAAAAAGRTTLDLAQRLGEPAARLRPALVTAAQAGDLVLIGDGDGALYLAPSTVATLEQKLSGLIAAEPRGAIAREEARAKLPVALSPRAFDWLVADMAQRRALVATDDKLAAVSATEQALAGLSAVEQQVLDLFARWGKEPGPPKQVAPELRLGEPAARAALDKLLARKLLIKIKPDLWMHAAVVATLRAALIAHLTAHAHIDAGGFKELTGTSRKYSIPLAEYFDAEKLTLRIGDLRRLR